MAVMQEAQRLRWVRDQVAASTGRQLSDAQWAEAAGLRSPEALEAALRDGHSAAKRLIREHKGFLVALTRKFTHQVQTLTVQHMHTVLPQCTLMQAGSPTPRLRAFPKSRILQCTGSMQSQQQSRVMSITLFWDDYILNMGEHP